ncbi:hypothetical protein N0V84_012649 [Fusarium piperis]|uniref:Uncharacterized protein n=1 Tax=Fusarium piperis TaxID=1435070 RepID=A0A9W8T9R6_9HYPO|nr:hypothetical protein N0V84_012649 [Fusarium piperis]
MRKRYIKARDEPREVPCVSCINRMDLSGPISLCRSQESPNTVACFACAKVGRKCLPAKVLNWDTHVSEAKEAVLGVRQNPLFVPNPPTAINQGVVPSPEPPQSPQPGQDAPQLDRETLQLDQDDLHLDQGALQLGQDTPHPGQEAPADDVLAAILRNNELVAKGNRIMRRVAVVISAFVRGESPPPTQ